MNNENENKNQGYGVSMDRSEESPEFGNGINSKNTLTLHENLYSRSFFLIIFQYSSITDYNAGLSNENKNQLKDSKQSESMTVSRQMGYELSQPSSQHQPTIIYRVSPKQETSPKKVNFWTKNFVLYLNLMKCEASASSPKWIETFKLTFHSVYINKHV